MNHNDEVSKLSACQTSLTQGLIVESTGPCPCSLEVCTCDFIVENKRIPSLEKRLSGVDSTKPGLALFPKRDVESQLVAASNNSVVSSSTSIKSGAYIKPVDDEYGFNVASYLI